MKVIHGYNGVTSTTMMHYLVSKGFYFSPRAVGMGLMRYAKRGLLHRKRIGHEFMYIPTIERSLHMSIIILAILHLRRKLACSYILSCSIYARFYTIHLKFSPRSQITIVLAV